MRLARWLVLLALLIASPAWAQSVVLQGGAMTAGHAPMYVNTGTTSPVIQDSGTAAGGAAGLGLKELGMTLRGTGTPPYANAGVGPNGENFCDYDAPITNATGGHYLCLSPNAQGGALISTGSFGSAAAQPLQFMVNGSLTAPAVSGGYSSGAVVCYSTTSQSIVPCPAQPSTMAYQSSSAVAITGGTIVGLPSPTTTSSAATKAYVDSVATGLNPLTVTTYVTTVALPTNTYANGALGVGATLTATANGALSVDGTAVTAAQTVLVNNEVTAANNGIYTVTAAGTGGTPYVLTRVTYFDQSAEMVKNSYTSITGGTTQANSSWILAASVPTVGSSPVNFSLFTAAAVNTLANGKIYVGNASNVAIGVNVSGDATISNTGALTVTKTSGVSFATSATTDTTVASNIASGTLASGRLPAFGSGDVSFAAAGGTGTIASNAVTNAKAAQMATNTIKGNNTTSTGNAVDLTMAQARVIPGMTVGGTIHGLTLSNDGGTPATVIDTAAGEAASDDTTPTLMVTASAITKSVNVAWAAGTGNGCLDTGVYANTTYHIYSIERLDTGVVDELCSTSATAPTMPANYTVKRRIGSIVVSAGSISLFTQVGDQFLLTTGVQTAVATNMTTALTITLGGIPTGIIEQALVRYTMNANGGATSLVLITSLVESNQTAALGTNTVSAAATGLDTFQGPVQTNTSAQIRFRSNNTVASSTEITYGWIDTRGK